MISWDNMEHMAKATGGVKGRDVTLTATEVGGQGRTAQISGVVHTDGWFTVNIKAPNVNCQGVDIRWFVPPPPQQ
jgi:hypothetical protein